MPRFSLPRQSLRSTVSLMAQCRTQSGLRDLGEIADISSEGCCVRVKGLYFRVGTRVVVRPQGMEGLTGVVRWVNGDHCGVQFDRAIYQPVLDHLVRMYGVTATRTISPPN